MSLEGAALRRAPAAQVSEEDYPQVAEAFFLAVGTFSLLNPGDWPLAEALRTYSRPEPGDFLLYYPASWELVDCWASRQRNERHPLAGSHRRSARRRDGCYHQPTVVIPGRGQDR
jgi:hypothetical protein